MNLQKVSPTFSFNPSKPFSSRFFTPSLHINPHANSVSNSRPEFRFCSSRRRASEPLIVLRSHRDSSVAIKCEGSIVKDDAFYMKRCVEIARKAIGCTSPNPMVGCVIVKDGVIVGEGFHPKAGQPHAEVFALRDAGDLAENATAYVSLEPCNHYGRTPPCTEALIAAKVKRVVVGMVDPNPIVASKGVAKLREAGIDVTFCVEEELCKKLNEAYIHRMLTGKPFVALRYSLSINGCFSQLLGEGADMCGGYYSQLLQEYDGIIYSSDAITLKPFPTSQEPQAKQPLQILIARSPSSLVQFSHLTPEAASQVIVFADRNTAINPKLAQQGVETIVLDQLHLDTILDYCAKRGLCSVLLDLQGDLGGLKELLEEGLENDLLHKVVMEILPVWDETKKTVAFENLEKKVLTLKNLYSRNTGKSVVIHGYFVGPHVN